jgi:hypothetical protein
MLNWFTLFDTKIQLPGKIIEKTRKKSKVESVPLLTTLPYSKNKKVNKNFNLIYLCCANESRVTCPSLGN